jgi:hypothetical protein
MSHPEGEQFIAHGLHVIAVAMLCLQHGRLIEMQYDRHHLNNAYFRRSLANDFSFWSLLCVGFLSAGLLCSVYKSIAPMLVHVFQAFLHAIAMVILYSDRTREQRMTISTQYMQHKYGVDSDLLWQLVSRRGLPHFPIVHFESSLDIVGEKKHAYKATDDVRARMCALVQRKFILPLSESNGDYVPLLALYKEECRSTLQCDKLNTLIRDFYATQRV